MSIRAGSCLQDQLSEYAAGRLPAAQQRQFDLHLVACDACRRQVTVERRLQADLADTVPRLPERLRSSLLAMAAVPSPDGTAVPAVPIAPFRLPLSAPPSLPVVPPSAPALHRSALRSAMMATVVAGASAAAVWSVGVTGAGAAGATVGGRPAAPTTPAGGQSSGLGGAQGPARAGVSALGATFRWQWGVTAVTAVPSLGAESTP